jgi:hypothetical protein
MNTYKIEHNEVADFWHANYQLHKDKYNYYFYGANKHGLLDICDNGDGNVTVLFKEDCKR